MNIKFGRKCVFRLERSSLGHQVRIRRGWCRWIHRTPWGDHLTYRQEIVVFILYRSEIQVWSKTCVSSGEVFSGPSRSHKASVVSLDSHNPRQEIVVFILFGSEHQVWLKMCVSSGEVFSGPSSPHKARVVSLDSQNPVGGPFDIETRNCRGYPV